MKSKENHKYLLNLYNKVDDYLTNNHNQENLPDIVVSFCIIIEKIFKIKLYEKNPVLIFESSKIKENDALIAIIDGREKNIETAKIGDVLDRFSLAFKDIFSDDELQTILDIYLIRNNFVHSYKPDSDILLDEEDITKKLGTVWEKASDEAIILFGKDNIKKNKPKKKYSEEELEKVLTEEVRKKIQSNLITGYDHYSGITNVRFDIQDIPPIDYLSIPQSIMGIAGEQCPRCGHYGFSLDEASQDIFSVVYSSSRNFSDLYKCKKCNLELTRKEYEIAKKIKV